MLCASRALNFHALPLCQHQLIRPESPSHPSSPTHLCPTHSQASTTSTLALAFQSRNRERPALMSVSAKLEEEDTSSDQHQKADGQEAGGAAAEKAPLEVVLWRADAVAAVVEVDSHLEITRADAAAGLLFGVSHRSLIKRSFKRWGLMLPDQFLPLPAWLLKGPNLRCMLTCKELQSCTAQQSMLFCG